MSEKSMNSLLQKARKKRIPQNVIDKIKDLLQRKIDGDDIARDEVDRVLKGHVLKERKQAWEFLKKDTDSIHSDSAFIEEEEKDYGLNDEIVQIIKAQGIKDFDIPDLTRKDIELAFRHKPHFIDEVLKFFQRFKKDQFEAIYELRKMISEGKYGCEVHICRKKREDLMFAAKKGSEVVYLKADQEIKTLSKITNPKVAHYCEYLKTMRSTVIVMELCGGSVEQFLTCKQRQLNGKEFGEIKPIDPESGDFSPKSFLQLFKIETMDIMRQSAEGIKCLHTHKPDAIAHGGIKPSNLLLFFATDQAKTIIKIGDFGLSRKDDETNLFLPPEHFRGIQPTIEADIFSLGLTFFYIMTGGSHVYGDDPDLHKANLEENRKPAFNEALPPRDRTEGSIKEFLDDENRITTCDMIRRMLKFQLNERFSIHDVTAHPTFWNSKKKVDFYCCLLMFNDVKLFTREVWFQEAYKTIDALVEENWRRLNDMDLNCYDNKLTTDGVRGKSKFIITANNIPKVCQYVPDWIPGDKVFSFAEGRPVSELLKIMRHKKSHGKMKDGEKYLFCKISSKGKHSHQLDWDKFLSEFTGKYPQLLVHLYEKFRSNDLFEKDAFYPSA